MAKKKVLFHNDNAQVHSNHGAQQKLNELRFELLSHPAYSPDLVPSDFHLFQQVRTFLPGQKFVCIEEAIQAVNYYFEALEENHFRKGIRNLERWVKCVELRGDHVEE